jgi:MinD superfamily P-loop ATPase
VIDQGLCKHCGECSDFCQYNALAAFPHRTVVYPELCRACGGCAKICPEGAIRERERLVGEVHLGQAGDIGFIGGEMRLREIATVPVIRAVRQRSQQAEIAILDAPPGTACPMVASIRGADAVLLVTDPTPFALHDVRLAADVVHALGLRAGVVVNRAGVGGEHKVEEVCRQTNLPIWGWIPDDRRIAESYSEGNLIPESAPKAMAAVQRLAGVIKDVVLT